MASNRTRGHEHERPDEAAYPGDGAFSFDVVDYEVPPARTTQNALLMLNRFTDGRRSTTTMAVDLLLRHEDGAVIIGEVKVAKAKG
jgi:hypothetical protein